MTTTGAFDEPPISAEPSTLDAAHARAGGRWWLRPALAVAVSLGFGWLVVTRGLSSSLAEIVPEFALRLNPNDPVALLALAEWHLNLQPAGVRPGRDRTVYVPRPRGSATKAAEAASASDPAKVPAARGTIGAGDAARPEIGAAQIKAWAERALAAKPTSAQALRILGQLADLEGDRAGAARLMEAAVGRSIRESVAVYWLMLHTLETRNFKSALYYAEVLMQTQEQLIPTVAPVVARIAASGNTAAMLDLKRALAGNPRWREHLLAVLQTHVGDARISLDLLLALKDTGHPPTSGELGAYLDFLIGKGLYELAYYTWLQFLPDEELARVGRLFNGSFETAPSGLAFDWVIPKSAGVAIGIVPRPDQRDQRALQVEFGVGRVEFAGISQVVTLAPGGYRLRGQYRGEINGRRGLRWRVSCMGGGREPLAQSPMFIGKVAAWTGFEAAFTVPAAACAAQRVQLVLDARSASEQLVSGQAWYDNLEIEREADTEPAQKP